MAATDLDLLCKGLSLLEGILQLDLAAFGGAQEVVPLGVELVELLLGVGGLPRALVRLDDLPAGVVEGVDRRLVSLDVVHHHLQLGKLNLDDLSHEKDKMVV